MNRITFGDGGLFYLYDKGFAVSSKTLRFHSHKPEDSDEFARWTLEAVGYPHVKSTQEIGVADFETRTTGKVRGHYGRGTRVWVVKDLDDTPPAHGWEATVHNQLTGFRQWLGKVLKVVPTEDGWLVECERVFGSVIHSGSSAYFYRPGVLPTDNLFVPKLITVEIWNEEEGAKAGPVPGRVDVYRRFWPRGMTSFYFADKVAEVTAGESVQLDAGYYAFVAQHDLQDIEVKIEDEVYIHHYNEPAARFDVVFRGAVRSAYNLVGDIRVEQAPQDAKRHAAPGKPSVIFQGRKLFNNLGEPIEGEGGVYFGKGPEGSLWVGRNVVACDEGPRVFVKGCKLGKVVGQKLMESFYYRPAGGYLGKKAYELSSSMVVYGDYLMGVRSLADRLWSRTGLQVVWAGPPEPGELPADYDGGWVAAIMVPGDRTEAVSGGDVIRLGLEPDGEPAPREYVVSESGTGVRYIPADSPYALDDSWRDRTEVFTWFIILGLDPDTGLNQDDLIRLEALGKYISVTKGWETRFEVWRFRIGRGRLF